MSIATIKSTPEVMALLITIIRRSINEGVLLNLTAVALLCFAVAPVALPFVQAGFPQGHDTTAHVTYIYRFDRALAQGQFPVRWVEGTHPGHNQPLFNFYQVGFYYVVEVVHRVIPSLSEAFKTTPVLLWWLGTGFMLLLLWPYGFLPAVAGSVLFALSPYAIVDVFVRSAYPEFAAIVFAVGALWAFDRVLRTGARIWMVTFAFFEALTLICHLPAALIAVPLFAAQFISSASHRPDRQHLLAAAAGGLLGFALASFYVLPALAELPLVQIRRLTENSVDFHNNFVPPRQWTRLTWSYAWNYSGASVSDVTNLMPLHINAMQWAVFGCAAAVALVCLWRNRLDARFRILIAWLGVVAVAMFMMTDRSVRVWDAIPALAFIQFPWRFFLLLSVAGGVLAAALLSLVASRRAQAMVLLIVIAFHISMYHRRLRPAGYVSAAQMNIDNPDWRDTGQARQWGFFEGSYNPVGVTRDSDAEIGRWHLVSGVGVVREGFVRDDAIGLDTQSQTPITLRFHIRYFPGWTIRIDGSKADSMRTPEFGFMEVNVPAGTHRVVAQFRNTPVRLAANAVSLGSAFIVIMVLVTAAWKTTHRSTRHTHAGARAG
jgi:hypothetical protein